MHIIEVIAGASASFNHPYESYANFKPSITLKAIVEDGEDPDVAARTLQAKAQRMIDDEKARILEQCKREQWIEEVGDHLKDLPNQIKHYRQKAQSMAARGWDGDDKHAAEYEDLATKAEARVAPLEERLRLLRAGHPLDQLPAVPSDGLPF